MELNEKIGEAFGRDKVDLNTYSPLALAFLGDCVFEIVIRTMIVEKGNQRANSLHNQKSDIVNAGAQARIIEALMPELREEEKDVYRRGKNAKVKSSAKNASIVDYHKATGLEALCGYLYLQGKMDRVIELVRLGVDKTGIPV